MSDLRCVVHSNPNPTTPLAVDKGGGQVPFELQMGAIAGRLACRVCIQHRQLNSCEGARWWVLTGSFDARVPLISRE